MAGFFRPYTVMRPTQIIIHSQLVNSLPKMNFHPKICCRQILASRVYTLLSSNSQVCPDWFCYSHPSYRSETFLPLYMRNGKSIIATVECIKSDLFRKKTDCKRPNMYYDFEKQDNKYDTERGVSRISKINKISQIGIKVRKSSVLHTSLMSFF